MGKKASFAGLFILASFIASAQTDMDAIMMEKNAFCVGPMYAYSSWKNYWEGTLKRDNQNLGTVSTQMYWRDGQLRHFPKTKCFVQRTLCKNQSFCRYIAWNGRHTGP